MSIDQSRDLKPAPIAEITAKNQRASNHPLLFHRNKDENRLNKLLLKQE